MLKKYFLSAFGLFFLFFFLNNVSATITSGPNSPQTMADDATVGTIAWGNPNNAKVSDNVSVNTTSSLSSGTFEMGVVENSIKLVKNGIISGDDKSTSSYLPDSYGYVSYGGSSDLWGLTWTAEDINRGNFGVAYSAAGRFESENPPYYMDTVFSHYLKATNFSFSIPTGATIRGILAEIKQQSFYVGSGFGPPDVYPLVDHMRITVYYTTDTCTYSGSGDWNISIADNCTLNTNTNLSSNKIVFYGNNGIVTINSTISARQIYFTPSAFNGLHMILIKKGASLFFRK